MNQTGLNGYQFLGINGYRFNQKLRSVWNVGIFSKQYFIISKVSCLDLGIA